MKNKYKIILVIFCLMFFGLINNYSAKYILPMYSNYFLKELIWYIAGFIIIFIVTKININIIFKYSFSFYLFAIFLLIFTLFFGKVVNGSRSWLEFGPISLQPSEFVKIALIIYLYSFTKKKEYISDLKYILITFLIVLIPSILTFLEPDTGAVLIYLLIYIAFLITKKLNKWWYISSFVLIVLLGGTFFTLYFVYQDIFIKIFGTNFFYRMDRITYFIKGEGYQINKALISIGSSGLFGRGVKNIPEYFPEAPTDFAFALLINNIGFIGTLLFLGLYFYFFYLLIKEIDELNKNILFPIILILMFHFVVNILMNIGLFPIIGITLPFLSYGGSNLLSYMILMSLVINIKKVS